MHVCMHMYSCMYIHMGILGSGPRLIDLDYTHMYREREREIVNVLAQLMWRYHSQLGTK